MLRRSRPGARRPEPSGRRYRRPASRFPRRRAARRRKARELLPARYPYVYEFRGASELDPTNTELHRELAYLLLP